MKRRTKFSVMAVLFVLPMLAFAQGLVPCTGERGNECQFCMLAQLIQNVVDWLVVILAIVTAIAFVYAGIKLVLAGGNAAEKEASKRLITNTFIGFVIVLAGWLIIDLILKMLLAGGGGSIGIGASPGPWNAISCEVQPQSEAVTTSRGLLGGATLSENCPMVFAGPLQVFDCASVAAGCSAGGGTPTTDTVNNRVTCDYPAAAYAGSCNDITDTSNPCHPSNPDMVAAFGSRAAEAAIVCNKESAGAPIESRSDICCGTGSCSGAPSFSGGYFQINILTEYSRIPGCSGSFFNLNGSDTAQGNCVQRQGGAPVSDRSVPCTGWSCEITDMGMYQLCMNGARDSSTNFAAAGQLFSTRGFQPWSWSANICGVPF